MATKAWVAKQKRREALVKKFAEIRRELKKQKNYAAIARDLDAALVLAVGRDRDAGDRLGVVAAEVGDDRRDLGGRDGFLDQLFGHRLAVRRGVDYCRDDGVHAHGGSLQLRG